MTTTTDYRYYVFLGANAPVAGQSQYVVTTKDYAGAANDLVLQGTTVAANGAVTWHTGPGTTDTQATYTGFIAPDGGPIIVLPPAYAGGPNQYYALTNSAFANYSQITPSAATSFACFLTGTEITTPDGPKPVEALRPGQAITLHAGAAAEIAWIGWRTLESPDAHVGPIRVQAHTFGFGQPARDLYLSPEHAVFTNGVLIPIKALVNGHSIAPVTMPKVTYFHILLARHDIILAEGMPCESLLDIYDPVTFANAETAPLSLAFLKPCAPILTQGPLVELTRARVNARVMA